MTPEERDELRRDLDAAGCPGLAEGAGQPLSTMSDDEREELRSLLRREVWVVNPSYGYAGPLGTAVFSREHEAADYAARLHRSAAWKYTIDAEVPDADG